VSDGPLVLCADDDEDILALVSLRLERAGFDVATAPDGEAAVEIARERRPAVAVLDVMMPKRTGLEVLMELRSDDALRDTKVILLSARVQESDVARGLEAGADAYMAKPFKALELVAKVRELLGHSPETHEPGSKGEPGSVGEGQVFR
jgi:DNA-binding response OmpR family regulator